MKIIVNADDFGYSNAINYGIIDAYKEGVLTSTTLMVDMPGTIHAINLMKENPGLGVGLHLNFTLGKPLTNGKTLVGKNGEMIKPLDLPQTHKYSEEELWDEALAQFNKYVELTGKKPTHIDTHLFSSDKVEEISNVVVKFAKKNNIPVRNKDINSFPRVKFICHHNFSRKAHLNYLFDLQSEIFKYEIIEIMVHPGYVDQYLIDNSSYTIERVQEVEMLCGEEIKELFKRYDAKLISYKEIKEQL